MCGQAETKLDGETVWLKLGYFGGYLAVGDHSIDAWDTRSIKGRTAMVDLLAQHDSRDLASMIVRLVLKGDEY